jgi:hypothetical protein
VPTNEKTYRGIFNGYSQYTNWPHEHVVTLVNSDMVTKVPVVRTNMLSGVQPGEFVEIDTQTGIYHGEEVVLRVRFKGWRGF